MTLQELTRHRRVTIMGLGLFGGGLGAARFWSELGSEVTVTDLRDERTLAPSIAKLQGTNCRLVLGEHREEDFRDTDLVIVNPAVHPDNKYLRLARSAGAEVLTEIGLVFRIARGPVLGVTGSNGKSTTTALLGAMVRAHDPETLTGGNIGGSLLPLLKDHRPSAPLVLELSSFQLHYLKLQDAAPHIAVVTNLSPNHLDWHKSLLAYYEDKRNIVGLQSADDWAVLNVEDPTLAEWALDCPSRVLRVARTDPQSEHAAFLAGRTIRVRVDGAETDLATLNDLRLPGEHNVMNALQAAASAFLQTKSAEAVGAGLREFTGLPHRLQTVAEANGRRFINDSIATTPESVICALRSFDEPIVLIAGGRGKGMPFDDLGREIVERARAAVLVGETAGQIREAIQQALLRLETEADVAGRSRPEAPLVMEVGNDFDTAVRVAGEICPAGGVVLLSPACASYDLFVNFEQRGEVFARLARRFAQREPI